MLSVDKIYKYLFVITLVTVLPPTIEAQANASVYQNTGIYQVDRSTNLQLAQAQDRPTPEEIRRARQKWKSEREWLGERRSDVNSADDRLRSDAENRAKAERQYGAERTRLGRRSDFQKDSDDSLDKYRDTMGGSSSRSRDSLDNARQRMDDAQDKYERTWRDTSSRNKALRIRESRERAAKKDYRDQRKRGGIGNTIKSYLPRRKR